MKRYLIYPAIAPLVFALAITLYHWERVTLALVGWNLASSYLLFLGPSLIVAAVDTRGLKRGSDARLMWCIATMLLVTVIPFAVVIPGARFEVPFLLVLMLAAIVATCVCYWISAIVQPSLPGRATGES
jgi:hypothetical protein